jgi:hypothetical protein
MVHEEDDSCVHAKKQKKFSTSIRMGLYTSPPHVNHDGLMMGDGA